MYIYLYIYIQIFLDDFYVQVIPFKLGKSKNFFEEKKYKAKSVHEARSSKMQIILLYFSKQTKFLMTYFLFFRARPLTDLSHARIVRVSPLMQLHVGYQNRGKWGSVGLNKCWPKICAKFI